MKKPPREVPGPGKANEDSYGNKKRESPRPSKGKFTSNATAGGKAPVERREEGN